MMMLDERLAQARRDLEEAKRELAENQKEFDARLGIKGAGKFFSYVIIAAQVLLPVALIYWLVT